MLQAQISDFKCNLYRNIRKQICELKRASGSQRLQLAPSKLSIKIPMLGRKTTSGLTVKRFSVITATDTFSTNRNLFANKSQKRKMKNKQTPRPRPRVGVLLTPNNFRLFASQIDQSMFTFVTFPRYKVIFSSRVYLESQPTAE